MKEKKHKFALWIYPSTMDTIERYLEKSECRSKSDFIEKAILFYAGFLAAQTYQDYIPNVVISCMKGSLGTFERRTSNVSFSGGVQWEPKTRVGSFQLKVTGTSGVTTITNEDFLVSLPDGSGSYDCEANVLTVILSTDCIVNFETNGGTPIDPVTAIYGELLTRPEDPVREGKHLVGWYEDIHLTEEWDFENDTVKGNMTLYAKWADGEPAAEGGSCIICGGKNLPIPGIPLCLRCLLILLLILVILIVWLIYRHEQKKRKRRKGKFEQRDMRKNKQ